MPVEFKNYYYVLGVAADASNAENKKAFPTVRWIKHVMVNHGPDLTLLKALFGLLEEVERLRLELRFLRQH